MPTYAYRCGKCGFEFEKVQKFSDEALKTCPNCKSRGKVKRLMHATSIVFKGSGFYKNDSRKISSDTSGDSKPAESVPKSEPAKAPVAKAE